MPKPDRHIKIRPQFRAEIDVPKLLTVLLAVAQQQQAREKARREARCD